MAHRADLTQQHGFLHAGIVATGLDSACGYAAFTLMPADAGVLTIEFKVNLLAPARGPQLTFEGTVTKAGRTISVVDGRAWESAGDGKSATGRDDDGDRHDGHRPGRRPALTDNAETPDEPARTRLPARRRHRRAARRGARLRRRPRSRRAPPRSTAATSSRWTCGARWASSACSASPSPRSTAAPAWATSRTWSRWRRSAAPAPSVGLSYGAHSNLCVNQIKRNGSDAQRAEVPAEADQRRARRRAGDERAGRRLRRHLMKLKAEDKGGDYVLNGSKMWITNGPDADTMVVYAKTEPELGARGVTAFLVEKGMKGFCDRAEARQARHARQPHRRAGVRRTSRCRPRTCSAR